MAKDISTNQMTNLQGLIQKAPNFEEFARGLRQLGQNAAAEGKTLSLESKNFSDAISKVRENPKLKEELLAFAGLNKDQKNPGFNTSDKNKQLVGALAYLLNNEYNQVTDRQNWTAVKDKVEHELKIEVNAIDKTTSLIAGGKPAKE